MGLDENSRTRFSLPDDVKLTKRERELRDGLVEKVSRAIGSENVITDVEAGERVLDMLNGRVRLSRGQKRALETASASQEEKHPADFSSTDGAKILQGLRKFADSLENLQNNPVKTFSGKLAKTINAKKKGSNSQYQRLKQRMGKL